MIQTFRTKNGEFRFDPEEPIDISIPLRFSGKQPNAYGVTLARSEPVEAASLIGDTRRGGTCNFERITFVPHCNGTHTECVGHITHERISIRDCLQDTFVPAILISVEPEDPAATGDSYSIAFSDGDQLITRRAIETSMSEQPAAADGNVVETTAMIVRTRPNDPAKMVRKYDEHNVPPFFTSEALTHIVALGFDHLLVDVPSIDRLYDEGHLSNHRLFWTVDVDSFEVRANSRTAATITEFIYVPDEVNDGLYLLNLQIAPFESDASPSRPVLFALK